MYITESQVTREPESQVKLHLNCLKVSSICSKKLLEQVMGGRIVCWDWCHVSRQLLGELITSVA